MKSAVLKPDPGSVVLSFQGIEVIKFLEMDTLPFAEEYGFYGIPDSGGDLLGGQTVI